MAGALPAAADLADEERRETVASYRRLLDTLARGDADATLAIDTPDWHSVTVGQ